MDHYKHRANSWGFHKDKKINRLKTHGIFTNKRVQ